MSTSTSSSSTSTTTTSTTSTTSTSTTQSNITIEDFRTKIDFNLQDDAERLTPTDKELSINHAVRMYSRDRPLEKIHDDSNGDGSTYDFTLPYDWDSKFSQIIGEIEYPVSSDLQQPQYVDGNNWLIYKTASSQVLRFLTFMPSSAYSFRYHYLITHVVTDDNCTICENDFDAVCALATGFLCQALAAKFAQTEQPTIEADVIDYQRKTDVYSDLAKAYFQQYDDHMGVGDKTLERKGAMATKDLDIQFSWTEGYITHPKKWR